MENVRTIDMYVYGHCVKCLGGISELVCFTNCEHNKCRHFDTLREVQSDFTSSAVQSTLEGGGDILEIYC